MGGSFFGGEGTTWCYPATMHRVSISGLREAASMAHHANARAFQIKVERSPSKNTQACAVLLADLFREPDIEFGSFSVIFSHKSSDPKSTAILRVALGGPRNKSSNEGTKADQQHSNKLLFQQLQSHYNNQQQLHVDTWLSRQQAMELSEVRGGGGDEMRLHYLCEKVGIKSVGRRGLGPVVDSVFASIKAERSNRRTNSVWLD